MYSWIPRRVNWLPHRCVPVAGLVGPPRFCSSLNDSFAEARLTWQDILARLAQLTQPGLLFNYCCIPSRDKSWQISRAMAVAVPSSSKMLRT